MPYGGFRRRFRRFKREPTKITCADCGKEDEVPFKPREGTQVYCRECFMKRKGIKTRQQETLETKKKSEEQMEIEEEQEESEESEDNED